MFGVCLLIGFVFASLFWLAIEIGGKKGLLLAAVPAVAAIVMPGKLFLASFAAGLGIFSLALWCMSEEMDYEQSPLYRWL